MQHTLSNISKPTLYPTPNLKQRRGKKLLKHFLGRKIFPDIKKFSAYNKSASLMNHILFIKMISKDTYAKWCLEFPANNLSLSFLSHLYVYIYINSENQIFYRADPFCNRTGDINHWYFTVTQKLKKWS